MALRNRNQEHIVTTFSDWVMTGHHDARFNGQDPAMWANPEVAQAKAHEIRERLRDIPPDTRSITAQFFGDPIPNDPRRSA